CPGPRGRAAPRSEQGGGLPGRARGPARAVGGLPAPRLPRGLERRGKDLGLPLPRLALRPAGPGDQRAGQPGSGPARTARDGFLIAPGQPVVAATRYEPDAPAREDGLPRWRVGLVEE